MGAKENKKSSTVVKSSTGLSQSFPDYRGLGGNQKNIATAALQSVEHDSVGCPYAKHPPDETP